ncbi:hypothetical protein ABN034_27705 [Actinopolymorpha sp. B11F2]|uniref:hypothetical protein n=1 Tax=Actinopolymorpha sp. B11F2 TaxID=3160862 RepID=UPI0032E3EA61
MRRTQKTRMLLRAMFVALLAGLVAAGPVTGATASLPERMSGSGERRSYAGSIDGAEYRVEVPQNWNGTLVLFSHGYYIEGVFDPDQVALSVRPETESWLLDHGYALAASDYKNPFGYAVADAQRDQIALLDWFDENVGRSTRTVTSGMSQGGVISTVLAERNPHRFDGVATTCAEYDTPGSWNTALDVGFVVKTLLAPGEDIELVRADDPQGSTERLLAAAQRARQSAEGRARLALAGAVGNLPTWFSAHDPEPTELARQLEQQAAWVEGQLGGLGPIGRVDLEARTGGNPSWNVGVDYRRLLAKSAYRETVEAAYREAGLDGSDLEQDLRQLDRAPKIAPDAHAVAFMFRHGLSRGHTPVPVITMHNTGDGGAIVDQERWYAEQVQRYGDPGKLRQLYVDRGMHCAFSAGDEIVQLRTLLDRVRTGRWPDTSPRALNAAVAELGPDYQLVLDIVTGQDRAAPPAFTRFTPPRFLRPSR